MKSVMRFTPNLILLLLVCICSACESGSTTKAISAPQVARETPAETNSLHILTRNGEELGSIRAEGTTQYLSLNGTSLTGVLKGVKRKYQRNNQVVAEVKSSDAEAFKLRNPDGSLRWKIKLYEDRVKISDNEENLNPYQIRTSEGKFKLKDAEGQEIGRIVQEGEQVLITSEQHQFMLKAPYRMSYGVLLIPEMPQQDQLILLAELQDRGY